METTTTTVMYEIWQDRYGRKVKFGNAFMSRSEAEDVGRTLDPEEWDLMQITYKTSVTAERVEK